MTGIDIVLCEARRQSIIITADFAEHLLRNYTSWTVGERSELTLRIEIRRYFDTLQEVA